MSDFLNHLVARATGTAEQITPRPASRFEPDGRQPDGDFEELAATTTRRLVSEPPEPTRPVHESLPQPPSREAQPGPAVLPPPDVSAVAPRHPASPREKPEPPVPAAPGPPAVVARPEPLPVTDRLPAPAAAETTPAVTIAADPEPPVHHGVVVENRQVTVTTHRTVVKRMPVEHAAAVPTLQVRAAVSPVPLGCERIHRHRSRRTANPRPGAAPGPDPAPPAPAPTPDAPSMPPEPTPGVAGEKHAERAETTAVTRPPASDTADRTPRLDGVPRRRSAAEPSRQAEPHTPAAEPPSVEVHIGRIEIRSAATPPPAARKRAAPSRVMPLDEYLARRRGGS